MSPNLLERVLASPALDLEPARDMPRLVHQTYRTRDLPPVVRSCVDRLRSQNPDWDHRFYDDADCESFIAEHYGADMLDVYRRIAPGYGAARADLFRYLVVYRLGGVYLDIKSGADRPLETIRRSDGRMWLSHWSNRKGSPHAGWGVWPELDACGGREFQQWYVAAPPGHPYLRAVIEDVVRNVLTYDPVRHGVGQKGVVVTTGPIAFTRAVAPRLAAELHEIADGADALGLRYSLLDRSNEQRHVELLGEHYTSRSDPVVALDVLGALRYGVRRRWLGLCALRRHVRGLGVSFRAPAAGTRAWAGSRRG